MMSMKREEVVNIKKIYISFLIVCLLVPLLTSVKASAAGEQVSIGVPTLNVRTGPGLSYPVLMQAAKGEEYTVTGNDGDWYKIDTPQGEGWVAEWLVTQADSAGTAQASASSGLKGTTTEDSINIRKAPSTDSERLGTLSSGEEVSITGSVQGWYEISYDGGTAWINQDYLSLSGIESGAEEEPGSPSATATVNVESLLVRDEASLNGSIVGKVTRGESYSILEESNEWYRIQLSNGGDGWVAGWFMKVAGDDKEEQTEGTSMSEGAPDSITILYDGTNLRSSPNSQASVVERAGSGSTFDVVGTSGDWYEIRLSDGASAFVANWIVSSKKGGTSPAPETSGGLEGKTIVLDPGHGGRDGGTTGVNGTHEKNLTLKTAQLVADKLRSAGAEVILTRRNDEFISLPSRVSLSHYYMADAFVSLHFDSIYDSSITGHTTYYNGAQQKDLAESVHSALSGRMPNADRGVRNGDYHVIRENMRPAVLVELGFLSNASEEANVNTAYFQDTAATSIYYGLSEYFTD